MATGIKCVKYIGVADIRRISGADWRAIGVRFQAGVEWSAANGFTILGDKFKEDAIKYLRTDDQFVVLQEDEPE